jgi:hypothetical protein
MEIPNLSANPTPVVSSTPVKPSSGGPNMIIILILAVIGITGGFWISRISPKQSTTSGPNTSGQSSQVISTDKISGEGDIKVGKTYGDIEKNFKDTASGVIQKGSVNGEGTHYLDREGGITQRAALTSSVLDLDLFVGHKVEIKGETNASTKAGWFLDVGSIKVLE